MRDAVSKVELFVVHSNRRRIKIAVDGVRAKTTLVRERGERIVIEYSTRAMFVAMDVCVKFSPATSKIHYVYDTSDANRTMSAARDAVYKKKREREKEKESTMNYGR